MRVPVLTPSLITVLFALIGMRYVTARVGDSSVYACLLEIGSGYNSTDTLPDIHSGHTATRHRHPWKDHYALKLNYFSSYWSELSLDLKWSLRWVHRQTRVSYAYQVWITLNKVVYKTEYSKSLLENVLVLAGTWSVDSQQFALLYGGTSIDRNTWTAVGTIGDSIYPEPQITQCQRLGTIESHHNVIVYSPDGRNLKLNDTARPYDKNLFGWNVQKITDLLKRIVRQITWSPDGNSLAYFTHSTQGMLLTLAITDTIPSALSADLMWGTECYIQYPVQCNDRNCAFRLRIG